MSTTQTTTDIGSNDNSKKLKVSPAESRFKTTATSQSKTPVKTLVPQKPPQTVLQKKIPRRSSKPIINWLQRKLAGKAKRTENHPLVPSHHPGMGRSSPNSNRQMGRIASSPLPVLTVQQPKQTGKTDGAPLPRRKTRSMSLNGDDESRNVGDDDFSDQLSLNRDSIWSPTSALEADDDASVRPLPPSSPPSPSPSRDSSSYLSDPRTFRSMTASTKPTTLLSIDLNGGGMAHIAQVPPSPVQVHRFTPHVRQSSLNNTGTGVLSTGGSVTFSTVPTSSRPSSLRINSNDLTAGNGPVSPVQAPLHSIPHPRNNPRPSSPPSDDASVLTLASSAFALSNRPGIVNYTPSTTVGDSVSHYGGSLVFPDGESTSQYILGDDERLEEREINASVRALRPRSSRRGSWESEASRWSARDQVPAGSSFARERSLRVSGSIRTGALSAENTETLEYRTPETATREIESEKDSDFEPEPRNDDLVATSGDDIPKPDVQRDSAGEQLLHRTSTHTIGKENLAAV